MNQAKAGPDPLVEDEDDRKAIVLGPLRLEFSWTGDRWAHSLGFGVGRVALVRSIEAGVDPDPARVTGPAYQQIHLHEEPDGRVRAMLVGLSGPHHFSAVFAPDPAADGGFELVVDLADRCRSPFEFFACTYLVERTGGDLIDADPARIAWEAAGGVLRFEGGPGPTTLSLDEAGRRATRVQALATIDPAVQTQRAFYRWRWDPAG